MAASPPVLFCTPCVNFKKNACSIGKVAAGQDIRTVSDCSYRELKPDALEAHTPDTAGDTPAKEA